MSQTSIILVNWNRWSEVETVARLLTTKPERIHEVIIVDNGSSTPPPFDWRKLPKTKMIFLDKNYGPCVARNRGAEIATGKFLFFLDSDAILSRTALINLEKRFEVEKDLGIIGARIERGFKSIVDQWIYVNPQQKGPQRFDTYSFSAAGAMIRADVYRQIGGFFETMYMHNEEVDLSLRVLQAGYRISYDSKAKVYHFPSHEGREAPGRFWKGMIRNWIWAFFRYYPTGEAYKRSILYSLIYVLKAIKLNVVPEVLLGILEGFRERRVRAGEYAKLTPSQIKHIDELNPRKKIIFGRS